MDLIIPCLIVLIRINAVTFELSLQRCDGRSSPGWNVVQMRIVEDVAEVRPVDTPESVLDSFLVPWDQDFDLLINDTRSVG